MVDAGLLLPRCPWPSPWFDDAGIRGGLSAAPCGAGETVVSTSTANLQTALNGAGDNATICFQAGVYRLKGALAPRVGQRLRGAPGAVLSGAIDISSGPWTGTAPWHTSVDLYGPPVKVNPVSSPACEDLDAGLCLHAENVFLDHQPLTRVTSFADADAGTFLVVESPDGGATVEVYLWSSPSGHLVEIASASAAVRTSNSNVTVETLRVEKFANPVNNGAVQCGTAASQFTVRGCEVRFNHGVGVQFFGDHGLVEDSDIHHNGQLGVGASGIGGKVYNTRVRYNAIHHNNIDGFWSIDGAAGGVKITETLDASVVGNDVSDNHQRGIWVDVACLDTTVAGNVVRNNWSDGVMFEISSGAWIHHNTVIGNAFGHPFSRGHLGLSGYTVGNGITVSDADRACIYANEVQFNMNTISLLEATRPSPGNGYTAVADCEVYANTIVTSDGGVTGVQWRNTDGSLPQNPWAPSSNNRYFANSYRLASLGAPQFNWAGIARNAASWQQDAGQDRCSTFAGP